jgi:hypothetical protein
MQLVRSLLTAGLGLTVMGTQVCATDFFVQPLRPGPVAGTPLSAIALQATLLDDAPNGNALAVTPETGGSTADAPATTAPASVPTAKWVKARKRGKQTASAGTTTTTTTTSTTTTKTATTSTSGATTTTTVAANTSGGTTTTTTGTVSSGPTPVLSAAQTFTSFAALMQSGKVKGGDRVYLLDGYHGAMVVTGQQYTTPVLITAMPGQVAQVDGITVRSSKNIVFQGLKVWASSNTNGLIAEVRSYPDTSDLTFSNLDVRAVVTSTNYRQWTVTDWNTYQRSGFLIDGTRQTVARNRVTGVYNGILMMGTDALMEENIIDGFAGDAMRALGDNSIVRRNKVQNCHQINASHTDGFQTWSSGPGGIGTGTLRNLTIEDNKIFEFVGTRSPIACKLQGLSMFDGMYDGFVIRNNLIATTAYHGITMGGALNSTIVNNTVIHAQGLAGSYPWIRVSNHKNGTPSQNVVVANNLVTSNKVVSNAARNISETNNIVVTNASAEFNSVGNRDFTRRGGAKAIDAGALAKAPATDIAGNPRPKGKAPDAGAYENF